MIRDLHRTSVCAAIALSLASGPLGAAEKQTLDDGWPARWSRIGPIETAVIGGLGLGALLLEVVVKPSARHSSWSGNRVMTLRMTSIQPCDVARLLRPAH